jgi:hypothetical protein
MNAAPQLAPINTIIIPQLQPVQPQRGPQGVAVVGSGMRAVVQPVTGAAALVDAQVLLPSVVTGMRQGPLQLYLVAQLSESAILWAASAAGAAAQSRPARQRHRGDPQSRPATGAGPTPVAGNGAAGSSSDSNLVSSGSVGVNGACAFAGSKEVGSSSWLQATWQQLGSLTCHVRGSDNSYHPASCRPAAVGEIKHLVPELIMPQASGCARDVCLEGCCVVGKQ